VYSWPGNYEIIVEVTDDDGGVGSGISTCDVLPVPDVMVETVSGEVEDLELPDGTENSLIQSLDTAMKVLEDSNSQNDVAAINALMAFIKKVEAQCGKKISEEEAEDLISMALETIDALGGET
jgi:hypothetical protein